MKRTGYVVGREQLCREIADLTHAGVKDLKERWRSLYTAEPPRRISRELLIRR